MVTKAFWICLVFGLFIFSGEARAQEGLPPKGYVSDSAAIEAHLGVGSVKSMSAGWCSRARRRRWCRSRTWRGAAPR